MATMKEIYADLMSSDLEIVKQLAIVPLKYLEDWSVGIAARRMMNLYRAYEERVAEMEDEYEDEQRYDERQDNDVEMSENPCFELDPEPRDGDLLIGTSLVYSEKEADWCIEDVDNDPSLMRDMLG